MEDIVIFRRKRGSKGQWQCYEKTLLKVEFKIGRFVIYNKLAHILGAKHNDAIMFGFSKQNKCAFIWKETPEEDSYYIREGGPGRPYFRFTSKQLSLFFMEVFGIDETDKYGYFNVTDIPNEKGWFKMTHDDSD